MTTWKEQTINNYAHDYRDMGLNEIQLAGLLTQFGNEILEKLIADIPDWQTCKSGDDGVYLEGLKQQLIDKWL